MGRVSFVVNLYFFKLLQIQSRRYIHLKLLKCQTFAWSVYFLIDNVLFCLLIFEGKRRYNIKLWKTFTDCFNCLPVAAILDEKIFCCHGGNEIPLTLNISLTEKLIKNKNGSCCLFEEYFKWRACELVCNSENRISKLCCWFDSQVCRLICNPWNKFAELCGPLMFLTKVKRNKICDWHF